MRWLLHLSIASAMTNVILSDDQFHRSLSLQRSPQNFYRRRYSPSANAVSGVAPDTICSVDSDCAGYPLAYCDGVCRCVQGALNAGSTCISSGTAVQPAGSCPPGQTYVTEAGSCMTSQQPGEPCQYSQQCAAAEPGAFCLRLQCECVYGMRQSGGGCTFVDNQCTKRGYIFISELGECREVLPPGGRGCSHNLQCTAAYPESTCFLQTCSCPVTHPVAIDGTCGRNCSAGETYSGVTGQCLPTVKPGDQCLYSSQCHAIFPGLICDRNRCRCSNGMVFSGTKCTEQCPSGYMANSRGICAPGCRTNQIEFEGECLDQAIPGSPCVVNAQCTGGASCQNTLCTCPRAMVARGSICVYAESPPLGSCVDGQLCTGGSFCNNGNCTCPVGRQIVNGQCVTPLSVDIGGNCVRIGVQCAGDSICVAGKCVCPLGTTPYENKCVEHRKVFPGESCAHGEECTNDSRCDENTRKCICIQDTKMVIGKSCQERLRSHPGYPCANNELCVGGSICRDGRCACSDDKIEVNKICVNRPMVGAGETCGSGETCQGGSECDYNQKKCVCKRGQMAIQGKCVDVTTVRPGDSCAASLVRCGGQSFCVRGRCECTSNMIPVNGLCLKMREVQPGRGCSASDLCTGGSVCRDGSCQCTSDMILRNNRCEQRYKVLPLEPCRMGDICLGNSECNGHVCECPPGHVKRDDICQTRLLRKPGQNCHVEDICVGQSICSGGFCQCKPGEWIREVIPGGECTNSDECLGGSACHGGFCMCPQGQSIIGQVCKDIRRVSPGMSCDDGQLCEGGSSCDESTKKCKCPEDHVHRSGKCVRLPKDRRGQNARSCLASNQCPSGAECVAGECRCHPGLALSRFGFCMPLTYVDPGMSCSEGETCRGGSECRSGVCMCPEGLFLNNNKCLPPIRGQVALEEEETLKPCPTDGSCKLPNCFCSRTGTIPPGGLHPKNVPQMVILSFDDAITDRTINIYKLLFSGKYQNPNGCPIKGTFFVSHQFNNYDQTQWLHSRGNEIAVNSITHETLMNATKERWRHEMVGLRESLQAFSYVEESSIKGIRAPQLLIGGNAQFEMMQENDFVYDNSMPVREGPVWPQTLDYKLSWDCGDQNCPTRPFKGLWELPLQLIANNEGIWHTMARTAIKPYDTRQSTKQLLQRNFYRNYNGNRAPFVLTADSDFITYLPDNGVVHAIDDWLTEILNKTDVYVVTASQAIEWMRNPTPLAKIHKFKPWQCNFKMNDHIQPCENPSICSYDSRSPAGMPHSFRVCGSCPKYYPWIEDPLGRKQLRKR